MLLEIFYVCAVLLNAPRTSEANKPKLFKSCFEGLGCISTSELWYHKTKRPVNLEPLDRHTIRTNFMLLKRNGTEHLVYDTMVAKAPSIQVAGFKRGSPVLFLIHDFTSNGCTGWVKHLARVALGEPVNVISVDWEAGAEPPFDQAVANARVVGLEVVAFLKELEARFGVTPSNVRIVGHGVGAHIAGYVGAAIMGVQKIVGLDPTGPYFEGMPFEVRLDKGDAVFVEVLHTDAYEVKSQGTTQKMGHVDFYINNAVLQPGCNLTADAKAVTKLDRNGLKEGQILPDCSHKRSFKYYIEALERPDCKFLGIPCTSYENFVQGQCTACNPTCAYVGIERIPFCSDKKLFLNTGSHSPFCMYTYVVDITISEHSSHQTGRFEMIIVGDKDQAANATSVVGGEMKKFRAGKTYTLLFYAPPPKVLEIREARVKWIHKSSPFCVVFCSKDVYVKEVQVGLLMKSGKCRKSRLRPVKPHERIVDGNYLKFVRCRETAKSRRSAEV